MSKVRSTLANLALLGASAALFLLVCELVVFRYVFLPAEVPRNAFIEGLIRYTPNQTGVYRVRNEISAPFSINAQGWNSGTGPYRLERSDSRRRIAVIGDSYVEALQVPYDRSVAERLQAHLAQAGSAVDVYRFAISGAPLSHYVYMIEHEAVQYAPDVVVIVLVHNDFDESFRFMAGRYTSSFMKLTLTNGRVTAEIPPAPYKESWRDRLRQLATVRYFYYRWQVSPALLRGLVLGSARAEAPRFEANIDVNEVLSRLPDVGAATDYLFGRLAALGRDLGFEILLVMDANRGPIYAGAEVRPEGASALNVLAREMAARHGLGFLDLTEAFTRAWQAEGARFEFASDGHWNERGHQVAADAIARALRRNRLQQGAPAGDG